MLTLRCQLNSSIRIIAKIKAVISFSMCVFLKFLLCLRVLRVTVTTGTFSIPFILVFIEWVSPYFIWYTESFFYIQNFSVNFFGSRSSVFGRFPCKILILFFEIYGHILHTFTHFIMWLYNYLRKVKNFFFSLIFFPRISKMIWKYFLPLSNM